MTDRSTAPGESALPGVQLRLIEVDDPLHAGELDLRYRLLRRPLGMPRGSERQPDEADLLHFVAVVGGERVIGCVAFRRHTDVSGQLLQMAVDDSVQGRGLGRRLVRHLERQVEARGFREVTLHARDIAVGFYEKLGYRSEGGIYVEVGIPHRNMRRQIADRG